MGDVVSLFPAWAAEPPEPKDKVAHALRHCLIALADEASRAALPAAAKAIELAAVVVQSEQRGFVPEANPQQGANDT